MDVTTVNNAVSDAIANLPAGTSSFINDNIGTAAGQQAIYNAGVSLGLSQAQIAAVVSQATGQTVTPQQVAQVAATVTPAATAMPAYKAPPVDYGTNPDQSPTGIASPTVAPAAPVTPTTTLANIAAPASPPVPVPAPALPYSGSFIGTNNPGSPGTYNGIADATLIAAAQKANPDVFAGLQNGTLKFNNDGDHIFLTDTKTGKELQGIDIRQDTNGNLGVNIPTVQGGGMIQIATKVGDNGLLAPVNTSGAYNIGVNQSTGGFAGGVGGIMSIAGPALAIINPALIPYLAAYNAASAVNKKQYGLALVSAAVAYGGFNPDSALANLLKNGDVVPTDATSGQPLVDSTQPVSGATTSPVYSPDVTGTPLSALDANAPVAPVTNVGTPISQVGNTNPAFNGTELTPAQVAANTNPINTSSLANGGVQNFGAGAITDANLAGLQTAYSTAGANGGFTSGYQTLPNGSKVMIQNDGTAIQTNPSTGQTTSLDANQVRTLVNNGTLNSASSGYNTATGGTPIAPGGGTINANGTTTLPNGGTVTTPLNSVAPTTNALGLTPVQTAVGLIGGASVLGNLSTNKAIANAAGTQAQAGQAAQGVLTDFGQNYGQLQAPYQQTGVQATNTLSSLGSGSYNIMNPDGTVKTTGTGNDYLTHQFNAADLQAGLAPNYDFMLAQGQGANRNLANASGGQISGNTLQGLNTFSQNYAGNAYQNAFANYQTQRQNIYNNLSNQAGLGQTSLGQLGQVGSNLAQTYGNVTTGLAASQAGATTAQAVNNANLLSNLAKTGAVIALA
jgi:hypothetical protein